MSRSAALLLLLPAIVGLSACGSGEKESINDPAAPVVRVESSKDACTPETKELAAGSTRFAITNTAGAVTELYIYEGKKVVGEVENVGPGTTRNLTVRLTAGVAYELACKPGGTGDGIRVPVTVK